MNYELLPEGRLFHTPENQTQIASPAQLRQARENHTILEGMATRCDAQHNLWIACGSYNGLIPREETALGVEDKRTKEIAILSRVGKPTCFTVTDFEESNGTLIPILSRRKAQELAMEYLMGLQPGDVIPACVTHLEPFGVFVDVGCGIPSMIAIEHISVSRIPHPVYRFSMGQELHVLVTQVEPETQRLVLSHKELLGTWEENAACFAPDETVTGYVRSVKDYGAFIELAPNLSGLAEPRSDLKEGDRVSVFIKSITPERMKIKLLVIERLPPSSSPSPLRYFHTEGRLEHWQYAPAGCHKGTQWNAPPTPL